MCEVRSKTGGEEGGGALINVHARLNRTRFGFFGPVQKDRAETKMEEQRGRLVEYHR